MAKKPLKMPELPPGERLTFFRSMQDLVLRNGDHSVARLAQRSGGYSHQAVYKALTGPKVPSLEITKAIAHALEGDRGVEWVSKLWWKAVSEERFERQAERVSLSPHSAMPPEGSGAAEVIPLRAPTQGRSAGVPIDGGTGTGGREVSSPSSRRGNESPGSQRASSAPRASVSSTQELNSSGGSRAAVLSQTKGEVSAVPKAPHLSAREVEILRTWLLSDDKSEAAAKLHVTAATVSTHIVRIRDKYARAGRIATTKTTLLARALQDGYVHIDEL